uniref:EF-hand domain-containing protein n=1 Tax=Chromera velia CCMP2878 TaxID=1169474 RepID=A0A0G4G2D8_9ALVE|eukprot:Cvel_19948.t1-p1 / transcript=Cvel_19948.t1 / gene=Cvel_19948 / organism=Chromera_velia_CCMP2878 / gene_product=hypothetical protein / transcript_product=hypothetical protein / location=Cvel_scaffold1755:21993-24480(-) / protein_length=129 / sequence_SO=supercontig / SO=protein_coding / is_pseudo=false
MDPSNDQHGGEERRFSSGSAAGAVRVEAESLCTVFTLLDVKASGNIPREKVPLALRMLGMPLTRREVEQALRTADPLHAGEEPSSVSLEALEYNLKNFGDCLDSNEVTFLRGLQVYLVSLFAPCAVVSP